MDTVNGLTAVKPPRGSGEAKLTRRLTKLANTALDSLEDVLTDEGVKAADRISAVKLTFELLARRSSPAAAPEGDLLLVRFEGIENELAQ